MIEVIHPGFLTTIQDLGRRGHESYGMPPSGAFDPFLATIANQLVGNRPGEPLLEFALTGPSLRFHTECWAACCGNAIRYAVDGKDVPRFSAFRIPSGTFLEFREMRGWFGYLAIGGSFQTTEILGSCSTYLAGRIGSKLEKGTRLSAKEDTGKHFSIKEQLLGLRSTNVVDVLPGLHHELFSDRGRKKLVESEYLITTRSNRMGIHLQGNSLSNVPVLRSAPTIPGTIQVPRAGMPIILGPEGPTTGGYPQLAILSRVSWTLLAGTQPGQKIRFQWTDVEQVRQQWRFRQRILDSREAWQEVR